jgi:NtrC-family two-component system response regulator AlgB
MRILIVDDETNIRKTLRIAIEPMGHTVEEAGGKSDALRSIERSRFDVALLDLRLGTDSGLELLDASRQLAPRMSSVIITAHGSIDNAVDAMRRGAADYLPKPFTPSQIRAVLERVEKIRKLRSRVDHLEEQLGSEIPEVSLETTDAPFRLILSQARQAAATAAPILIRGESGTGKGVLARAIHSWSRRAQAPFVTVSCPSLSAELLESALFGHARGSFTGAVSDTEGKVAAAEGGSLFLDEIGDLPLALQPKLLRFLQDRHYERVGENRTRAADVRLIAATNRDLDTAVAESRFRDDLLFRLNVIELMLPPLRSRDDRLTIAHHLLEFFARQTGKRIEGFTERATQAVLTYSWPGNLRELRNAMERAVIFAADHWLDLHDLPNRMHQSPSAAQPAEPSATIQVGQPVSLETIETEHIRQILAQTPSREDAAKILNIDPSTLYRKRRQLGL